MTDYYPGDITSNMQFHWRRPRAEVLAIYRKLYPEGGGVVWDGETLTRRRCQHGPNRSACVDVTSVITFHDG